MYVSANNVDKHAYVQEVGSFCNVLSMFLPVMVVSGGG